MLSLIGRTQDAAQAPIERQLRWLFARGLFILSISRTKSAGANTCTSTDANNSANTIRANIDLMGNDCLSCDGKTSENIVDTQPPKGAFPLIIAKDIIPRNPMNGHRSFRAVVRTIHIDELNALTDIMSNIHHLPLLLRRY